MSIEEKKERLAKLQKQIEMLQRTDRRRLAIAEMAKQRSEWLRHRKQLAEAGEVLERAGILDGYDEAALLKCLKNYQQEILQNRKEDADGIHQGVRKESSESTRAAQTDSNEAGGTETKV